MSQKRIGIFIIATLALLIIFTLYSCNKSDEYIAADDEIALQIKLDTKEDIGLLLIDYDVNGSKGSGGISNADKSMLKHGELVIDTMHKEQEFENLDDIENLKIQFKIVTKYFEPNYDNVYPDEYVKTIDSISLKGEYGKSYNITITGDKTNGYKAILE